MIARTAKGFLWRMSQLYGMVLVATSTVTYCIVYVHNGILRRVLASVLINCLKNHEQI